MLSNSAPLEARGLQVNLQVTGIVTEATRCWTWDRNGKQTPAVIFLWSPAPDAVAH